MTDVILVCRDCGNRWEWQTREQAFFGKKGWQPPTRCPDCRKKNRQCKDELACNFDPGPDQMLRCVNCDVEFLWTQRQQIHFRDNNFAPPKRCYECRKKFKNELRAKPPRFNLGDAIRQNLGGG